MNLSVEQSETLRRWLPVLLAAVAIWVLARGLGKLFQAGLFGLVWIFFWIQGFPRFLN